MPKVIRNGHNEALIHTISRVPGKTIFHLTSAGICTNPFDLAVHSDDNTARTSRRQPMLTQRRT